MKQSTSKCVHAPIPPEQFENYSNVSRRSKHKERTFRSYVRSSPRREVLRPAVSTDKFFLLFLLFLLLYYFIFIILIPYYYYLLTLYDIVLLSGYKRTHIYIYIYVCNLFTLKLYICIRMRNIQYKNRALLQYETFLHGTRIRLIIWFWNNIIIIRS